MSETFYVIKEYIRHFKVKNFDYIVYLSLLESQLMKATLR